MGCWEEPSADTVVGSVFPATWRLPWPSKANGLTSLGWRGSPAGARRTAVACSQCFRTRGVEAPETTIRNFCRDVLGETPALTRPELRRPRRRIESPPSPEPASELLPAPFPTPPPVPAPRARGPRIANVKRDLPHRASESSAASDRFPPATASTTVALMTVAESLQRWRALPLAERRRRRWERIPRNVASSMAFEGEPVDLVWLEELHRRMGPPVSSKRPGVS